MLISDILQRQTKAGFRSALKLVSQHQLGYFQAELEGVVSAVPPLAIKYAAQTVG